jgi:hypothetical protein
MIVGYQPGGSIKDSRVVLKPNEKLPNRFNIPEAIVYVENPDNPREWLLVKPLNQVLPQDSPLLSQPELPNLESFSLTMTENSDTIYEHRDIIRMDEEPESE